mmetsp:Transcript_6869/g.8928  ORF Transcript_6869/g.8928 Transcript_6869/m.8928 type:complete len:490 (-) Transcript_6869:50-1519(-)
MGKGSRILLFQIIVIGFFNLLALSSWRISALFYFTVFAECCCCAFLLLSFAAPIQARRTCRTWASLSFFFFGSLLLTLNVLSYLFSSVRYSLFWDPTNDVRVNEYYQELFGKAVSDSKGLSAVSKRPVGNLTFSVLSSRRKPDTLPVSLASLFQSAEYSGYGVNVIVGDTSAQEDLFKDRTSQFSDSVHYVPLMTTSDDWHLSLYMNTLELLEASQEFLAKDSYLVLLEDDALAGKESVNVLIEQILPVVSNNDNFGLLRLWSADKYKGWGMRREIIIELIILTLVPSCFAFVLVMYLQIAWPSLSSDLVSVNWREKIRFSGLVACLSGVWLLVLFLFIGRLNVLDILSEFSLSYGLIENINTWSGNVAVLFHESGVRSLVKYLHSYPLGTATDGEAGNSSVTCREWDRKVNTSNGVSCVLAVDLVFTMWAVENGLDSYRLSRCLFEHMGFNSSSPSKKSLSHVESLTCRSFQYEVLHTQPSQNLRSGN